MDRDTYNKIDHNVPYIFSIEKNAHTLLYFGGDHSFDIEHTQNIHIEQLRKEFLAKPNPKKHAFIEANIQSPLSLKKRINRARWRIRSPSTTCYTSKYSLLLPRTFSHTTNRVFRKIFF